MEFWAVNHSPVFHFDYDNILYDKAQNIFHKKIESVQYNACLTSTKAIRRTSKENIYEEVGLESLRQRRWCRKLGTFYKILKNRSPGNLSKLIPAKSFSYITRTVATLPFPNMKHDFLKNSFIQSTIRNSKSFVIFKNSILRFIRASAKSVYTCHKTKLIKMTVFGLQLTDFFFKMSQLLLYQHLLSLGHFQCNVGRSTFVDSVL